MPIIQPEIYVKPAAGIVGRRANMEEWNTVTRLAQVGTLGFGVPVQRGTAPDQITTFTTGNFLGITEADMTVVSGAVGSPAVFPVGYNTPVCNMGVIWGNAAAACTAGTPVYWNATEGGYQSASASGTLVPNAEFDSTAAADGIVKIRLRRVPAAPAP